MPQCNTPFGVVRTRVVLLDSTGAPLDGPDNAIVTDATIQAEIGLTISTGDKFEQKNGSGDLCVSIEERDRITGATVNLQLCHLDAELIGGTTGARVLFDGPGNPVGVDFADTDSNGVSVELWAQAWDGTERAIYAPTGGLAVYRFVLPLQRFVPANHTLERGILRFPVNGKGTSNQQLGAGGPAGDWVDGPITGPYAWWLEDEDALPVATCGAVTLAIGS